MASKLQPSRATLQAGCGAPLPTGVMEDTVTPVRTKMGWGFPVPKGSSRCRSATFSSVSSPASSSTASTERGGDALVLPAPNGAQALHFARKSGDVLLGNGEARRQLVAPEALQQVLALFQGVEQVEIAAGAAGALAPAVLPPGRS